jgi:hypothetical protein
MPEEKTHLPHGSQLAKPLRLPDDPGQIIGYTGANLNNRPTVYFTNGHYTQKHKKEWNVGWESCEGWQCMFFGNVIAVDKTGLEIDSSSHDAQDKPLSPNAYVAKLKLLGKNRFIGGQFYLGNPDGGPGKKLREFWIRNNGTSEDDQFAHLSRSYFTPVPPGHPDILTLRRQLSDMTPPAKMYLTRERIPGSTQHKVVAVPPRSAPLKSPRAVGRQH